jgi:hypothetical protein
MDVTPKRHYVLVIQQTKLKKPDLFQKASMIQAQQTLSRDRVNAADKVAFCLVN